MTALLSDVDDDTAAAGTPVLPGYPGVPIGRVAKALRIAAHRLQVPRPRTGSAV